MGSVNLFAKFFADLPHFALFWILIQLLVLKWSESCFQSLPFSKRWWWCIRWSQFQSLPPEIQKQNRQNILDLFLLTPTKEEETQNPEFSGLTWGNLKVELTKAFDWPQSKFFCILPMHSACAASLAASEAATAYSSKIFGQFCPSQKNARIACCLPKTFHTWSKFNI